MIPLVENPNSFFLLLVDKKETLEEKSNVIKNYIEGSSIFENIVKMSQAMEWARAWYSLKKNPNFVVGDADGKHLRVKDKVPYFDPDSVQALYQALGNKYDPKYRKYDYNAADFERENETTAEDFLLIPRWDISLSQLEPIYHQARLNRAFEWKYKTCSDSWRRTKCIAWKRNNEKIFMRRIPWLYPDDGKFRSRITT